MRFTKEALVWTRPPERFSLTGEKIEIWTQPHTDL